MAVKYVDIEYLRAQNTTAGQLIVAGPSNAVTFSQNVIVDNNGNIILGGWNGSTINANYGGTGQTSYQLGDILYGTNSLSQLGKLPIGQQGNVLVVNNNAPGWGLSYTVDSIPNTIVVRDNQSSIFTDRSVSVDAVVSNNLQVGNSLTSNVSVSTPTAFIGNVFAENINLSGDLSLDDITVSGTATVNSLHSNTSVSASTGLFNNFVGVGTSTTEQIYPGNLLTVFGSINIISGTGEYLLNGDPLIAGGRIVDDTATNSDSFYITLANNQVSGEFTNVVVSSSKLHYNPAQGRLYSFQANIFSTTESVSSTTGALVVGGGTGIGGGLHVAKDTQLQGNLSVTGNVYGYGSLNTFTGRVAVNNPTNKTAPISVKSNAAGSNTAIRVEDSSLPVSPYSEWRQSSTDATIIATESNITLESNRTFNYIAYGGSHRRIHNFISTSWISFADTNPNLYSSFIHAKPLWAPIANPGNFAILNLECDIDQTGAASGSYSGIRVDVNEIGILGTRNKLIDTNVNGNDRFHITSSGIGYFSNNVGIGTSNPTSALHVIGTINVSSEIQSVSTITGAAITAGGIGIGKNLNVGGQIYTASILNSGNTAIVNALHSNTQITTSEITATNVFAVSGTFVTVQSSGVTTVNSLLSNTAVSGNSAYFNTIQSSGQTTVNSLVSNSSIAGQDLSVSTIHASGAVIVNSLTSNTTVNGYQSNFDYLTNNFQFNGNIGYYTNQLTVNSLYSNTTVTTTDLITTYSQNSGVELVQVLQANVYGVFGQNVSIKSSNSSISTDTGSLVIAGGVGIAENLNIGEDLYAAGIINSGSTVIANALHSNSYVTGTNAVFTTVQTVDRIIGQSITSNTTIVAGSGLTVSAGGATINGNSTFAGNVSITGNLFLQGNVITTSANILVVDDPIIYLGENNPANFWDIGLVGSYTTNIYRHTGFVRNHNDSVWTIFDNLVIEPDNTIVWDQPGLAFGDLKIGNLNVASNTSSFGIDSGSIITSGGVGIGENLNVDDQIFAAGVINAGGAAIVNSLTSNTAISGTSGTFTSIQSSGSAIVGSLTSNTHVTASDVYSNTATFITIQGSGTATVNSLISNSSIAGTTGSFASTTVSGNSLVNSIVSNTFINGSTLQTSGTSTVNALVSNTSVTGATIVGTDAYFNTVQTSSTAVVNNLVSNTTVSGTNATFTSIQSSGIATVNSLVSNGAVSGTTGSFTDITASGNVSISGDATVLGNVTAQSFVFNTTIVGDTFSISGTIASSTDTTPVAIDTWPLTSYRTAHYIAQVTDNVNVGDFQSVQFMVLHNNIKAIKTEYAQMWTNSRIGTFQADVVGSDIVITFTAFTSGNKTIKLTRSGIVP